MVLIKNFIILVLVGTSVAGCKSRTFGDSPVKHEAGKVAADGDRLNWASVTREEHRKTVGKLSPFTQQPQHIFASSHILSKRVDFWIQKIDSVLRKKYPDQLKMVPVPYGVVVKNDNPRSPGNAWISPVIQCFPQGTAIADSAKYEPVNNFTVRGGEVSTVPNCFFQPKPDSDKLNEIIQFVNKKNGPECLLAKKANSVEIGKGCRPRGLEKAGPANHLGVYSTGNFVSVSADFLTHFPNEHEFVSILAHELAHYYKSHSTILDTEYNYYYFQNEKSNLVKPPRSDEAEKLAKTVTATKWTSLRDMEGQVYASELLTVLLGFSIEIPSINEKTGMFPEIVQKVCKVGTKCEKSCKDYVNYGIAQSQARLELMGQLDDFNVAGFSEQNKKNVKDAEQLIAKCVADIPIVKDSASEGLQEDAVLLAFSLRKVPQNFEPRPTHTNLSEFLQYMTVNLRRSRQTALNIYKEAASKGLGWYTVEQEADELSIEILSLLGVPLHSAVESNFRFLELEEKSGAKFMKDSHLVGKIPHKRCQELYKNGWKDEAGNPIFVAVGGFVDTHHSGCFRAFNMDREIRAHKYMLAPSVKLPFAEPWSKILAVARAEGRTR